MVEACNIFFQKSVKSCWTTTSCDFWIFFLENKVLTKNRFSSRKQPNFEICCSERARSGYNKIQIANSFTTCTGIRSVYVNYWYTNQMFYNQWDTDEAVTLNNYMVCYKVDYCIMINVQCSISLGKFYCMWHLSYQRKNNLFKSGATFDIHVSQPLEFTRKHIVER